MGGVASRDEGRRRATPSCLRLLATVRFDATGRVARKIALTPAYSKELLERKAKAIGG